MSADRKTTDLEDWRAFLTRFGIGFEERREVQQSGVFLIMAECSAKVAGYTGFETQVEFSHDGTFVRIGAWE